MSTVQPVFHCNKNISAPVGDRYVKLTCIVEHPDVGIDKFAWVYGDSGTTIEGSAVIGNYDESSIEVRYSLNLAFCAPHKFHFVLQFRVLSDICSCIGL